MPTLPALQKIRTLAGRSQRGLAKSVGVSYQTIRRIELGGDAGDVPLRVLDAIATALRTTMPELLSDTHAKIATLPTKGRVNLAHVRLLRDIATNPRAGATMSQTQRELILPQLIRSGLVVVARGLPQLNTRATKSLLP
jgi:transcriptional regulator with XRE-family HTH domain